MATDQPTARIASGGVDALAARGRTVVRADRLHGGTITRTLRLHLDDGSTAVLKQRRSVPAHAWASEVDGLGALAVPGVLHVPAVIAHGDGFLLLEDLPHPVGDDDEFWEAFGRALARLHLVTGDRFGWHRDNMLGAVEQRNPWCDDGWRFFAEHRLLRYLELPPVSDALGPEGRAAVERVADRLDDLVPDQPPSLTHGDLWRPNVLAAGPAEPGVCDPAVSYTWAEVDLSMLLCSGGVPDRCFAAYEEVRPLGSGWRDRAPLLHVREHLSVLAHIGHDKDTVEAIIDVLSRFA